MTEKQFKILAIVATGASILMYVTYIFQIQANLAGRATRYNRSAPPSTAPSGSFTAW